MRKILSILFGVGLMVSATADVDRQILTVTTGTNSVAAVSTTNANVRGYLDQIDIDVVSALTTGAVAVVLVPELTTLANVTLVATTNANSDLTYRPRFDGTDTSGMALTNDPPGRLLICGDSIVLTVTNAGSSNIQFKAIIKYEK